ncbi:MAG: hypothetical protein K0R59_1823 [Sphingobacterium sp.]|jgi:hypothetical protein|nr:hypothetical protein [Sphingobacterium sp.]
MTDSTVLTKQIQVVDLIVTLDYLYIVFVIS